MHAPRSDHARDSYGTTEFESVHFKPKQTTGPEFYDRSNLSRKVGRVGVGISALFGWLCIFEGSMIFLSKNTISSGVVVISLKSSWEKVLVFLGLNLVVTACTEATGFVHGIALRSALASQRRLHFNTNLRLLSAARGLFRPNGTLCNIVMAILLIMSYSSSLLVFLLVWGVTLLLQAIIALASVGSADFLTWSSSPFDITAALVHHAQILAEPGRCMHGVGGTAGRGPVTPSAKQASAWRAHPSIRTVIVTLWGLGVVCVVWGIAVVAYSIPLAGGVYWYWALYYVNMACLQGPLTLALELVVNVTRDERVWKKATTTTSTTVGSHPLALVSGSPLNIALLVSKPLLRWMLGLAISLAGTAKDGYLTAIVVSMWPFQILNYAAALLIFALALTVIVLWPREGPQPAAYGHVQTLSNHDVVGDTRTTDFHSIMRGRATAVLARWT